MKFRFTKQIEGYDIHYNRRIKTGAVIDLFGPLADAAMKDPSMELIPEAPEEKVVKKAVKKSVKKAVKKAVKK